ncbi:MAG TPA: tetratricopeptide repeat protein [Vicinamibacterales bacterium]|jgi:putative PEP-CTERM system TPR-repeat lipoprotein
MTKRFSALPCLLAVLVALAGCTIDPNTKKTKFLESGDRYSKDGKLASAIIEYRNAVDVDPTWAKARQRLAEAYTRAGDGPHALEQYVRAADLLPNVADAQLIAGAILLAARKPEDALARADAALKIQPQNIQAHLLRGNALAGLSSFEDALKAIEEAIRLDPTRGTTFTQLGLVEFARGKREPAETAFLKAVALAPKSVDAHLALGNFYWSIGKAPETEKAFQRALQLEPDNAVANRALAAFTVATGHYRDAEQYLVRLAKSGDPSAIFTLSDYYLASGRAKDAITRLEALGQARTNVPTLGERLARAYAAGGDAARAKALVEQVLVGNPTAVEAQLLKGQLLLNEGHKEEAFAAVKSAASSNPESAEAQFALARMFAARGDRAAAETAFRDVLRINPRAASAQVEIARLQLSSGNQAASLKTAEEATRAQPKNVDARLVLVRSLMASKNFQRAETEIAALRKDYPEVAAVHVQAGMLALLKNDVRGARMAFERGQSLDPKSTDLLAGLIALDLKTNNGSVARSRIEQRLKEGTTPALLLVAARTYWATNDQPAAERALRQAIEADPALLTPYEMLGQLYMAQKKLDQARAEFETLATRQAKPVGPLTMSGMILLTQGQTALARKRFEDVLAIDPRAVIAANNLAWIRAEAGDDLDTALKLAQTAAAQAPDQPELMDTLGWVYYKKNLPQLAVPLFVRCVEKEPSSGMFRYHLGLAYLKTGQTDRGRAALQQALKDGVDAAAAADARRLLGT